MAVPLFVLENERRKVYKIRKLYDKLTDSDLRIHTGLPAWGAREIIKTFEPLSGHYSSAVPLECKVLCFLAYLRSGSFQYMLGSASGIAQPTVSKIINQFLDFTVQLAPSEIYMPRNLKEQNKVKQSFFNQYEFPNVLGCIDGTHVPIKAPYEDPNIYVCRKGFHSINAQIISGPDHTIQDLVAKWPGSTHDSFVYKDSAVRARLYRNEFGAGWLLGDSGYGLEERLLTPFNTESDPSHKVFNVKQRRLRNSVERVIGTWKSRFRAIHNTGGTLCYSELKACKIIVATAVLHNICVRKKIPLTSEDEHYLQYNTNQADPGVGTGARTEEESRRPVAVQIRQRLANNFL